MASVTGARKSWSRLNRFSAEHLVFAVTLAGMAFFTLYPLVLLINQSFDVGRFGTTTTKGFKNWGTALSDSGIRSAAWNTVTLAAAEVSISTVIALPVAWLLARSNLPGRGWLEFGFWIAFFLPSLTVTLGWILLFNGDWGLVNQWLASVPFLSWLQFDIFSWWGIVFAHLMTTSIAIKIMLLTPLLRNIDSSQEEASLTAGASRWRTSRKVMLPAIMPGLMVVTLLSAIKSMEAFEIELVLGGKPRINVISTVIYRYVQQSPPEYGTATALSMVVLFFLVPFILIQQYLTRLRGHASITGKHVVRLHDLGKARWPAFIAVATLVFVLTVLPAALVISSTFMKIFGFFSLPDSWTLDHWRDAFANDSFTHALKNTLILGFGAGLVGIVAFAIIAHISVRAKHRGRGLLDFLTWLPAAFPGIVMSLGVLWLFLGNGVFRSMYGTMALLMLAVVLSMVTLGVQVIKTNMIQLGEELEEASSVCGAGWLHTFRRVVLPPIAPALAVVGVLVFAAAVRATSVIAFLTVSDTEPLSITQLHQMVAGYFEVATTMGVVVMVLTVGVALVGRLLGLRTTVGS